MIALRVPTGTALAVRRLDVVALGALVVVVVDARAGQLRVERGYLHGACPSLSDSSRSLRGPRDQRQVDPSSALGGVNLPESWGKDPAPTPTTPRYERAPEFRQSLLVTARTTAEARHPRTDHHQSLLDRSTDPGDALGFHSSYP